MAKRKVYDSDEVMVYPFSGGTTVDWLKEAGLGDTIEAAPVTDLGGGKYQAQELPDGYSYVHYSGQPNDPTKTEETRGPWATGDNAWLSDEHWNLVQGYKDDYAKAQAAGDQAGMDAAHRAAEQLRYQYGYSGGVDGSNYLPTMAYTGVYGRDDEGDGSGGSGGYGGSGYLSKYQARIDALADAILNRKPFSYDKETDPIYQQYKTSYTRGGQRGMQDTLAQVSARTGGLASSYAQSAAQQTYNNYMAQLADKVPELYQLAYSMYMDDLEQDRMDLDTLMGLDNRDFDRYTNERDFNYGAHRDSVGDSQWQQQFDYNAQQDALAQQNWMSQFDYQKAQDALAQQNWQTQWDYQVQQDALARQDALNKLLSGSVGSFNEPTSIIDTIFGMDNEAQVYDYLVSQNLSATEAENYMGYWYANQAEKDAGTYTGAEDLMANRPEYSGKIDLTDTRGTNYQEVNNYLKQMQKDGYTSADLKSFINNAYNQGLLNEKDYQRLINQYR